MTRSTPAARPPCALTALGMVNALGGSLDEIWPRLIAGDPSGFVLRDDLMASESRPFAQVQSQLPEIPTELSRYACRNNQLVLAAFEAIRCGVESAVAAFGAERVGIVMGSSTTGVAEAEAAFRERAATGSLSSRFELVQLEYGGLGEFVARVSGASGPCYTLSTACSSGAKALVSAKSLLELDICDAVIAGAADSLCRLTARGFGSLQAVAKGLTNPMSRNRDGVSLGEGAVLFLMTREPGGIQLLGAGESNDAHHISAPEPGGRGAETCMRAALADAGLGPEAIVYLNLHGTGTPHNDVMESAAVERVFGRGPVCSSTKPLVGHTLGASGAVELAFCWMMLARRQGDRMFLPPHRFDGELDPELAEIDLAGEQACIDAAPPAALMSNSFGFGGSNCAVILGDTRP
jgi:3-oxoacyl-[acyl-carrier-protein] synthase-1